MIRPGFLDSESRQDLIELTRDGSAAHRLARRANALVLLDDGMSCEAVAKVLYLDDDTIRTWHRLYQDDGIEGLASFGYEGGACRLTGEQRKLLKTWITETLPRTTREVGAWIAREFGIEYEGRVRFDRPVASIRDGASQAKGDIAKAGLGELCRLQGLSSRGTEFSARKSAQELARLLGPGHRQLPDHRPRKFSGSRLSRVYCSAHCLSEDRRWADRHRRVCQVRAAIGVQAAGRHRTRRSDSLSRPTATMTG
jgi:transposase